jgi:hypothetical protein
VENQDFRLSNVFRLSLVWSEEFRQEFNLILQSVEAKNPSNDGAMAAYKIAESLFNSAVLSLK